MPGASNQLRACIARLLLEDILDLFACLLGVTAGLILLALSFESLVIGSRAHALLGLAGSFFDLVFDLVVESR